MSVNIKFNRELAHNFGIEQEAFLYSMNGSSKKSLPLPKSKEFLETVGRETDSHKWTDELSACQVEYRTDPHRELTQVEADLRHGHKQGQQVASQLNSKLIYQEVAPFSMTLQPSSHTPRYQQVAKSLPKKIMRAASRVAAVHIHYGCEDLEHAVRVYNRLTGHITTFMKLGDHSKGKRLKLYTQMAPDFMPPRYQSVEHFLQVAKEEGFSDNLRQCYHLVRISPYGTVELRALGNTADVGEIMSWVRLVRDLARGA